jgi:hypothetical protein
MLTHWKSRCNILSVYIKENGHITTGKTGEIMPKNYYLEDKNL